jgi:hypothetical protein
MKPRDETVDDQARRAAALFGDAAHARMQAESVGVGAQVLCHRRRVARRCSGLRPAPVCEKRANHRHAASQSDIEWETQSTAAIERTLKNRCGCAVGG